jgi:hypothetical protein
MATDIWHEVPCLDLTKIKRSAWVIEFFLARASIQLIFGEFGTRKTTAMLKAAWAVARGEQFLGMKTRQRPVLYIDYENPPDVVKSYCKDLGIDPSKEQLKIWDRSKKPAPRPDDKDGFLLDFVKRCKKATGHAPWIIFDSWTSLLRAGESGNDVNHATHIFRAIRGLCDEGATCTIIDHTGKNRKREPIGTSAKMTQMDTSHRFQVEKSDTAILGANSERKVVRVESFLKRYAPKHVGTFSFEVRSRIDSKGDWHLRSLEAVKDRTVIEQEKQVKKLYKLIEANPALGKDAIANLADKEGIAVRDRARALIRDGLANKQLEQLKKAHGKRPLRVVRYAVR